MLSPKGDPTYIQNKEAYFMTIAKAIQKGSTHPTSPGGCVVIRDREIVGDGRSLLTDSKIEIDCITYAVGCASKRGTPMAGSVIYTTRYPFSASIFQCHLMGIKKLVVLAHAWEPYYKDEFRRAARLARELSISIEPYFDNEDPRYAVNSQADQSFDEDLFYESDQRPANATDPAKTTKHTDDT
jgi:deoxycytidylate deaminase